MSGASVVAFCFPTKRPRRPDMAIDRIPVVTREYLLAKLQALPEGTEVSFSGLEFIDFEYTCRSPNRVQAVFDPRVYRTAEGEVVVENPE